MIRKIIQYFRSCSCEHEWEFISNSKYYGDDERIPYKAFKIYRCKKCGYVQKIKL